MNFKVKMVKRIARGYVGMNPYAAKELGIKCPRNTILVKSSLTKKERLKAVAHEKIEAYHMSRGLSYRKADRIARSLEKNVKTGKK